MIRNKLAAKVNNIDASEFVLKTEYQIDKTELKFLMQLILLKNQNLLNQKIKFQIFLVQQQNQH